MGHPHRIATTSNCHVNVRNFFHTRMGSAGVIKSSNFGRTPLPACYSGLSL